MPRKKKLEEVVDTPVTEEAVTGTEAVVYVGTAVDRIYTKNAHGGDFIAKANEYVSKPNRKGYRVEVR